MILHIAALVPAALGLCCAASGRGRDRAAESVAGALMLLAMVDAALTRVVPVVWWVAVLLAGAVLRAVVDGRARRGGVRGDGRDMRSMPGVHSAAAMVVMAAILLSTLGGTPTSGGPTVGGHHAAPTGTVIVVAAMLGAAYVCASTVVVFRARGRRERVQAAAMAASTLLMSLGLAA